MVRWCPTGGRIHSTCFCPILGNIIRADVLLDLSGRSKGQGTVLFESSNEAQKAIRTLAKHGNKLDLTPRFAELFDGTDFNGRVLTVHEDKFAQQ